MATPTPPIGIRTIEIENFRGIDSLRLDFRGPTGAASEIAVLAGPNGCGKTTVLEACLIALGYDGPFQGPIGQAAVQTGKEEWVIRAEMESESINSTRTVSSHEDLNRNPVETASPGEKNTIPCIYFSSWRKPKLVGSLPIKVGKRGKRPYPTQQNHVWRTKQHLINMKAFALMTESPGPSPVWEQTLSQLTNIWRMFYSKSEQKFVVEPVSDDPSQGFDVFLSDIDGRRIPVDKLSSGQLEIFAFFGALLTSQFGNGIIVIDEPELHLDPQWHSLLLRVFRRLLPAAQLIVATHSPRVYDSVLSFQRHFLIPDTDPRAGEWRNGPVGVQTA